NPAGIDADLTPGVHCPRPVTHQPAGLDKVAHVIRCGNCVACREGDQLRPPLDKIGTWGDKERFVLISRDRGEHLIDFTTVAGVEDPGLQPHTVCSRFRVSSGRACSIARIDQHRDTNRSRHEPKCSATNAQKKKLMPVALPAGRARVATRPSLNGSSTTKKTMGIVVVAALANAAAGPFATITATCRRTRSAANPARRSS